MPFVPDPDSVNSPAELVAGRDPTPGIVSVSVDGTQTARVWQRLPDDSVVLSQCPFMPWLVLASDYDARPLQGRTVLLPATADPVAFSRSDDWPAAAVAAVQPLQVPVQTTGRCYDRLLWTPHFAEVSALLVADFSARTGSKATQLRDIPALAYSRPLVEQYLIASGRTYFKGMTFATIHRLQFDLETTGLDAKQHSIFLIALRDNRGFEAVLDIVRYKNEADLLRAFVETVRERDPDVLENHHIFGFDIPFLIARAARCGVRLSLGRDATEFVAQTDSLKVGPLTEAFTRHSLAGREIIDTLHAIRRYDAIAHELRRYGLKEVARHFGFAAPDRVYIDGKGIAAAFIDDPRRVRRYALDDVREVDHLAQHVLGATFMLSALVPKAYERVATSGTGQGLIEPLLTRAFLQRGVALPTAVVGQPYAGGSTGLFCSGVLRRIAKADVTSLYPSIMLAFGITHRSDSEHRLILTILDYFMRERLHHKALARALDQPTALRSYHDGVQGAMKILINSFYGSLGNTRSIFGDMEAASAITGHGRAILHTMLDQFAWQGVTLIEADTDGVYMAVPPDWDEARERAAVAAISAYLPAGISVEHDGRWAGMYSYMEKNYALLGYDGSVTLKGSAFRSSRNERFGEAFLRDAIPLLIAEQMEAVHALYLDYVTRIRAQALSADDVAMRTVLTKSMTEYAAARRREEPYEIALAAGITWQAGNRITYYTATQGHKKIIDEFAQDYDADYYVNRLTTIYADRLRRAVDSDAFPALFSEHPQLFGPDLATVRTIATPQQVAPSTTA